MGFVEHGKYELQREEGVKLWSKWRYVIYEQPLSLSWLTTKITITGVPKEQVEKTVGSHWTMKLWKDGDQFGGHITCQEHPQFNSLEVMTEGVEKCVDSPIWGGKAKVS